MTDTKPQRIIYTAADLAWPRWRPKVAFVVFFAMEFAMLAMSPYPDPFADGVCMLAMLGMFVSGGITFVVHFVMVTEEEYAREQLDVKLTAKLAAARTATLSARIETAVAANLISARRAASLLGELQRGNQAAIDAATADAKLACELNALIDAAAHEPPAEEGPAAAPEDV